ncbi:MAG: hypothetical protein MR011_06230 [Lachnospiraceae bacterium]|nr:hypothetical protein [Lachnospiraceae bacterium]
MTAKIRTGKNFSKIDSKGDGSAMIKKQIENEQVKELKKYIPHIEELIQADDVQELLDAIDDVIVNDILGNNDEPTELGISLQQIYDSINNMNL